MKKIGLISVLICLVVSISYTADYSNFPAATTDDFLATKVNPAALGFGNASGIGYVHGYSDLQMKKDWALFLNFERFGYCYEKVDSTELHTLSDGIELSKNFYFGTDYAWKPAGFSKGNWGLYLLTRPWDFLSVAGSWRNISKSNENYSVGFGFRPIRVKGNFCYKITLTCDITYDNEKWQKPKLGLQTQFLDGIHINGYYNMEDKGFTLGLDFDISHFKSGGQFNNKSESGLIYGNISKKRFDSFIIKEKRNKFYDYNLSGIVYDVRPTRAFGPFEIVSAEGHTMQEIVEKIEHLKQDERIKGIVFQSGNMVAGLAKFQELQDAFLDFKSSGKYIVFFYDYILNSNYVFASSVADKIYLNPGGMLDLHGISISVPYVKALLDTLGIEVYNFQSHDYKNAANMFSETGMTKAEREMYERFLDELYSQMVIMIAQGRNMTEEQVKMAIDKGPYLVAEEAVDAGLVDGLIYKDQLEDTLKDLYGEVSITKQYRINSVRYDWSDDPKKKIAVIYAIGNIHSGKSLPGQSIGDQTYMEALKNARENGSIKGIILRIDSGGGSALASENIYREVMLCKEGENQKPVISSFSGVAASGGYYIACASDKIFAEPSSVTGSIGVLAAIPNLTGLFSKIHINWDNVKKGKNADFGALYRPLTDQEKEIIEQSIQAEYKSFVNDVAKGRKMSFDEVHKIAMGQVWTGSKALELGLIDAYGGMKEAIEEIKKSASIEDEVELVTYPQKKSAFKIEIGSSLMGLKAEKYPAEIQHILDKIKESTFYNDEKILLLMPYILPEIVQ